LSCAQYSIFEAKTLQAKRVNESAIVHTHKFKIQKRVNTMCYRWKTMLEERAIEEKSVGASK
jgi:hypothetical protein